MKKVTEEHAADRKNKKGQQRRRVINMNIRHNKMGGNKI